MLNEWFGRLARNETGAAAAKYALVAVLLAMAVYRG
jgi:Flp pilus assembly pilin Flp